MALVKVGIMAQRAPDGEFLPANPIYQQKRTLPKPKGEYIPYDVLAKVFADKFKAYKTKKDKMEVT